MKNSVKYFLFIAVVFVIACICFFKIIPQQPAMLKHHTTSTNQVVRRMNYVALGDSLTEGVGDDTKKGGFVPIVADLLQSKYHLSSIEFDNFGKAGDRSDQILKRLKKNEQIQKSLKYANSINLTWGGKDLLKVIRDHIFSLKKKTFVKPQKRYQKQLTQLIQEIRKYNTHTPIYFLGIYNPFYLNFPEFTQMQEIVTNWNEASNQTTEEFKEVYFIPINDLLYKGNEIQVGITDSQQAKNDLQDAQDTTSSKENEDKATLPSKATIVNELLSDEDRFHPNNVGYQLMAKAVMEKLADTKKEWYPKVGE